MITEAIGLNIRCDGLVAVMGEVNIALDFQGIKWYGLYIIKVAYVFLYPTPMTIKFKLSNLAPNKVNRYFLDNQRFVRV